MVVESKFAPTYTMTLNLLRRRSVGEAEALLERSFGQWQNLQRSAQWDHREINLGDRLHDLRARVFQHPRVRCSELTLEEYLAATQQAHELQAAQRRVRREHWRERGRGRHAPPSGDADGYEMRRRLLRQWRQRQAASPCQHCPYLGDHRANHLEIHDVAEQLRAGEAELRAARERYRTDFAAYRRVLAAGGYLEDDRPTELGDLAASLFGESALLVAQGIAEGWFTAMTPSELCATLVMLVAEDRGRDRDSPRRRHFPTGRVEQAWRVMRRALHDLAALEGRCGLETLRPLSLDYVDAAYRWAEGVPLPDIEPPGGADVGDVIKAVKNLYAMLRQIEQAPRAGELRELVAAARRRCERDLIRRI